MRYFCIIAIICGCWKSSNTFLYVKNFWICQFSLIVSVVYSSPVLSYSTGISPVFFNLFISLKALQAIGMAMVKLHASAQA